MILNKFLSNFLNNSSTFFGIGLISFYPGTLASFITAILCYLCVYILNLNIVISILIALILFIIAYYSIQNYPIKSNDLDPKEIVIDEVVGMFISLLGLGLAFDLNGGSYIDGIQYTIIGFLLFRIFDSFKPSLIYRFEIDKNKTSILLDDCIAGLFTLLIMLSASYGGVL